MTDVRAAYDPNRLPWLSDTRTPTRKSGWEPVLLWALLAAVLVAGVAYWAGMRSAPDSAEFTTAPERPAPAATVALPAPRATQPAPPEVEPTPLPSIEPAEPRVIVIREVVSEARPAAEASATAPADGAEAAEAGAAAGEQPTNSDTNTAAESPKAPPARAAPGLPVAELRPWPADVSQDAHGRVARIGTFSTRLQAKRAWWRIIRVYPGMKRLKAVVVPVQSLRNGRTYYRLQFGTTSQAHSAVLCQRMRIVGQSCVVVGASGG